jgi:hypothetical protein
MLFYIGLICLALGIYFLLVNFNIIANKKAEVKNVPVEAQKIDALLIRIASLLLCLAGIYLIWPESNKDSIPTPPVPAEKQTSNADMLKLIADLNTKTWNIELMELITNQCLENGKRTAEEYPDLVKDYCTCATEKISKAMTPDQYVEWMQKSYEEQAAFIRPVVQTCVDIMNKLIELSQESAPKVKDTK